MSYFLIFNLENLLVGVLYSLVSIILLILLIINEVRGSKPETENLSQATVEFEEIEVILNDGITTKGIIYRSKSETISTPKGRRYPQKRPVIIYFHGFWSHKEVYIPNLITLAHMGYIAAAFDQRGHGEAGGKKEEWYKLYNDVESILDSICSFNDTKEGSICCIGTSMGGTSVLTKAYEDKRVAMVIAISTLHDVDSILNTNFKFPSSGWFVKRVMGKGKNRASFKMAAKYYLKSDLEYNENRVYLIHGKQDSIFPPDATFELNKKQSKIPEEHALLLEDCGHGLDNQKILLLGVVLKWILNNEKMNLS